MNPPARASQAVLDAIRFWSRHAGWHARPNGMVVGVSGGVDSMVLLHALVREGLQPHVVHVHHGLRAESDDEEHLVRSACGGLGLDLTVIRAGKAPLSGRQAWARALRHQAFLETASERGARWVLVAHHADDQLETQLLHLERGTGLAGLVGMPASRPLTRLPDSPTLVRPLLEVSRAEIRDAAVAWEIAWAEDRSNRDLRYRRNAIRAELQEMDPAELAALRASGANVANRTRTLRDAVRDRVRGANALSDNDLEHLPGPVRELVILEWVAFHAPDQPRRRTLARRILALKEAQAGRRVRFGGVEVWRERGGFTVRPESSSAYRLHIERVPLTGDRLEHKLAYLREQAAASSGSLHAFLDTESLAGPPALRAWRAGDRFQPLGMQGSRKLKAYLTDRKVPPSEKSRVQVCCAGDDIVWVVGHQLDHRFRITEHSRNALILSVTEGRPGEEDIPG